MTGRARKAYSKLDLHHCSVPSKRKDRMGKFREIESLQNSIHYKLIFAAGLVGQSPPRQSHRLRVNSLKQPIGLFE